MPYRSGESVKAKSRKNSKLAAKPSVKQTMLLAAAAATGLLARQQLAAAGDVWNGADGTAVWGDSANWNNGTPANDADLTFTGAVGTTNYNATYPTTTSNLLTSVNSITFDGSASAFILSAAAPSTGLTIDGGGGIYDGSSSNQTINELLSVAANTSVTLANSGSGLLSVTSMSAVGTLSLSGSGNISLGGTAATFNFSETAGTTSGSLIMDGTGIAYAVIGGGTTSGIVVNSGTLFLENNAAPTGGFKGDTTVNTGGTVGIGPYVNGGGYFIGGGGGGAPKGNTLTLNGGALGVYGGSLNFHNPIYVTSLGGTIGGNQASYSLDGVISGNSTGTLTFDTSGFTVAGSYVPLAGANTFAGLTKFFTTYSAGTSGIYLEATGGNVAVAGNLEVDGDFSNTGYYSGVFLMANNEIASTSNVLVNSGVLNMSSYSNTVNSFTLNANGTQALHPEGVLSLGAAASVLTANSVTLTGGSITSGGGSLSGMGSASTLLVSGTGGVSVASTPITNFGSVTMTGGTLSLVGSSSITGATDLIVGDTLAHSAATLDLTGYTGTTGYTISSGQSLSGNGFVLTRGATQPLVIASGATLQPGDAPGVLNVGNASANGNISVASGSHLVYDLSGAGSNSDMVSALGQLNFGGSSTSTVNLSLKNVTLPNPGSTTTYELFAYGTYTGDTSSDITDDFSILLNGSSPNPNTTVVLTNSVLGANQIDLTITTVPEPASLSLLGLGAIGLLGRRRAKRKPNA